jgi:hypothetical protein
MRAGITRAVETGRAIEGIHAQARIVAQRRQAGGARGMARFQDRVFDETQAGLVGIGHAELRLRAQIECEAVEQFAQLDQFASIAAGQYERAHAFGSDPFCPDAFCADARNCSRSQRLP